MQFTPLLGNLALVGHLRIITWVILILKSIDRWNRSIRVDTWFQLEAGQRRVLVVQRRGGLRGWIDHET